MGLGSNDPPAKLIRVTLDLSQAICSLKHYYCKAFVLNKIFVTSTRWVGHAYVLLHLHDGVHKLHSFFTAYHAQVPTKHPLIYKHICRTEAWIEARRLDSYRLLGGLGEVKPKAAT